MLPKPKVAGSTPVVRFVPVHLTPEELAGMLGVEPHVVLNAAREVDVPIYHGRIDSVLFSEAIIAADHHLADRAREVLQAEGEG